MSLGFSVDALLPKARGGGQLRMGLVKLEERDWLQPSPDLVARAEGFAPALPDAPRPSLRAGDTFVFGRSTVRRVQGVGDDTLTWTTTDGQRLRTGRDFFTPVLEQTLPDRRITSQLSGQPADAAQAASRNRRSLTASATIIST